MFNEVLVEEGYAQTYPYEPNTRFEERLETAQEEARAAGLGIWGLTNAEQCQLADRGNGIGEGTPGCSASASVTPGASGTAGSSSASSSPSAEGNGPAGGVSPVSESDCPPGAPIKGNGSSGIYHEPGGDYYDETNPEECFATPQDAEDAGYKASEV